jgi:peptidoglycan/LPS O-acetylase OafA/YrhL
MPFSQCFFALSGFLVAGSYFRTKRIGEFVMLRILRIAPALAVEVCLCALVLGSIFTTLPLLTYFSYPGFWSYFGNLIGWMHFLLPGVFEDNPNKIMNLSLWTVPYELECYIAIVALALLGLLKSRFTVVLLLVFGLILLFAVSFLRGTAPAADGLLPHRLLVLSFLSGVLIFLYRDKVVIAPWLTVASILAMLVVLNFPVSAQFYPPLVAYTTIALGMSNPRRTFLINTGDYSYGIYLCAFPIQQAYVHLASQPEWRSNIVFALPITVCFAAFSWHCVEKHVLKLKTLLFRNEKKHAREAAMRLG